MNLSNDIAAIFNLKVFKNRSFSAYCSCIYFFYDVDTYIPYQAFKNTLGMPFGFGEIGNGFSRPLINGETR